MSQFLTCVVVDDELAARQTMCRQIERNCPSMRVLQSCNGASEAYDAVLSLSPDVVFLDIRMPHETGLQFLERFENRHFYVVFCTTYDEYAVEALRKQAFDYLLKPVAGDDLQACVRRIARHFHMKGRNGDAYGSHVGRKLEVLTSGSRHFVRHADIDYVEADGSYSVVHLTNGRRLTMSKNLKKIEEMLDDDMFFRVHNSFLVRLTSVDSCNYRTNTMRLTGGAEIQMSTRRREEVRKRLAVLMMDVGTETAPKHLAADDPAAFGRRRTS